MDLVRDDSLHGSTLVSGPDSQEVTTCQIPLSATLLDLSVDYILWTPAIFCLASGFDRDPAAEFMRSHEGVQEHLGVIKDLLLPIFADLPHPVTFLGPDSTTTWANTLWLCRKVAWPQLADFLRELAVVNRDRQFFSMAFLQRIYVYDVLAQSRGKAKEPSPPFEVFSLAADTNRGSFGFVPAKEPGQLPTIHGEPPVVRIMKVAKKILREHNNWDNHLRYMRDPKSYAMTGDVPHDE